VILARASGATNPLLLLLDEPTLHLDIGAQVDLLETLQRLARENRYSVVVVTHELKSGRRIRKPSLCCCKKVNVCAFGPPASVYQARSARAGFSRRSSAWRWDRMAVPA